MVRLQSAWTGWGEDDMPDWVYKDQPYWIVGKEFHAGEDGRRNVFITWRSFCAECGEEFSFKRSAYNQNSFSRRCQLHKQPGKRV
jgi:hypothetical protein